MADPEIPAAAIEAASDASPAGAYVTRHQAERMLTAAMPHLLPGLFVDGSTVGPCIWQESSRGAWPLMARNDNPGLFDILAALLPDRTDDED